MVLETSDFVFKDNQNGRIWIHSKERGFGKWFSNTDIEQMFKKKRLQK